MNRVSVSACTSYDGTVVAESLDAALAPLGSMAAFVRPGSKVLLKVNLLASATPDRAVTTHPEVVRALIRSVRSVGGIVSVGDSPGGPNTPGWVRRIHDTSGIGAVCTEEDVPLLLFDDDTVRVEVPDNHLYGSFTIGRAVAEADVLITVPKFKTHGFMMFTGAVKNLFGCIPGLEKARYHLTVPDRLDFGSMLVDLSRVCRPALSVMDAVVGMEGDGPAGGQPRVVGALLASPDPVSLDMVAAAIAGFDPLEVYTNLAAARRGLGPESLDEIDIVGDDWRSFALRDFDLPATDPTSRLPGWLRRALTSQMLARPILADAAGCTLCKTCEVACPVDAIVVTDNGPGFDRSLCIKCYCCQELCPPQVIGLATPPLARMSGVISRRRTSNQ
ncbi:MAG: DUF362 domain-containing protein [Coriobacteriia bacterium]|nr:DUF362 domain-containing protein [Coriobacteriia bacterium]